MADSVPDKSRARKSGVSRRSFLKTASCAAMALTFASYAAPGHVRLVGVAAVAALTAVNYLGVQKSAWLTRAIVLITLIATAALERSLVREVVAYLRPAAVPQVSGAG